MDLFRTVCPADESGPTFAGLTGLSRAGADRGLRTNGRTWHPMASWPAANESPYGVQPGVLVTTPHLPDHVRGGRHRRPSFFEPPICAKIRRVADAGHWCTDTGAAKLPGDQACEQRQQSNKDCGRTPRQHRLFRRRRPPDHANTPRWQDVAGKSVDWMRWGSPAMILKIGARISDRAYFT